MSLDYSSMRIFALTLSHRAIDDIRRDGLRQLRNYVDMCAILAKHPLAQRFFEYVQTLFEEPEPPYYTLAQRLIGSVSEDTLCTLGVNFGFGSMLYGSEKLAENLKEGHPISWRRDIRSPGSLSRPVTIPALRPKLRQGNASAAFCGGYISKARSAQRFCR